MNNDRYILNRDATAVYDKKTGVTWSSEQILDIMFERVPAQDAVSVAKPSVTPIHNKVDEPDVEEPMTADQMKKALAEGLDAAAAAEPWAQMCDDHWAN